MLNGTNEMKQFLSVCNLKYFLTEIVSKLIHHQVSKDWCYHLNESLSEVVCLRAFLKFLL